MKKNDRTSKVLKNAKISLLFVLVLLFLNFISRSVFINSLGPEILGLNTIATNLIGFLNLAELGISAAIASSLYKPLAENNKKDIAEIIAVQGWMYKKIAYIIMISAIFLMFFFPIIFKKTELPLWYAYSIFGVLLLSSLLTYFITYKQVLLVADMKEYKLIFVIKGAQILKIIFQILALIYLTNSFFYWVILELIYGISSAMILKKIIEEEYPWLNINKSEGRKLKDKHQYIIKHTKQLFFHKFSAFVLMQTTPIVIFAYASLTMVSIYDNYMMIVIGIVSLTTAVFSSLQPAIGNLVATKKTKEVLNFFYEYASLRFWLASVVCVVFYFQSNSFISLWVGEEFILEKNVFLCFVIYLFLSLTRVVDPFIYAYSLYGDIYAPILEAFINLTLSIVLGYLFGLQGILIGVIVSLLIIIFFWKPYYVFNNGFSLGVMGYFRRIFFYMFAISISITLIFLLNKFFICVGGGVVEFIVNSIIVFLKYSLVSSFVFFILFPEFRNVIFRIKSAFLGRF